MSQIQRANKVAYICLWTALNRIYDLFILVPIHTVQAFSYQSGLSSLLTILKFFNLSQNQSSTYLPLAHHLTKQWLQVRGGLIHLWAPWELQGANAKSSALLGSTGILLSCLNYVYICLPCTAPEEQSGGTVCFSGILPIWRGERWKTEG